jgi:hypothetical protein
MKLQIIYNSTLEEEKALINVETKEIIMKGDYYHDKINYQIKGYLDGLKSMNIKYELLEELEVTPEMDLFNICDFYNDN